MYSQGITDINSKFWNDYKDYLNMQIQIYGKIREKFPKYLRTEHDIMALKINSLKSIQECENFEDRSKEIEELNYEGRQYSVIVPTHPKEIVDEGVNLSHCVGSYVERIINGDCSIIFLRRSKTPEQSLVTLQLCGKRINQAEGSNRRHITEEERKFLKYWGNLKKIEIAV